MIEKENIFLKIGAIIEKPLQELNELSVTFPPL